MDFVPSVCATSTIIQYSWQNRQIWQHFAKKPEIRHEKARHDGYISSEFLHGIYIGRDGKWIIVPSSQYIKSIKGPDLILPKISE